MELQRLIDDGQYAEILRYASRLLRDAALAEDVAQETFLRLLKLGEPELIRNRRAWLYRTARNLSLDHLRRVQSGENAQSALYYRLDAAPSTDPADTLEQKEAREMLLTRLKDLPPRQREAIRLKFQEKLTYEEIAEVMGESRSTVGWLLHDAIAKLRRWLVP